MTGAQFGGVILGLVVAAIVVAIGVWLMNWLYLRSSKERAFVRTGLGGQKVVMAEKRGEYVKRVKSVVAAAILQDGLELETVSLTQLDQTGMEFFTPSNAFDAEGLTRLTEQIARRKRIRNDTEQDTMIQVRNKNLETERQALDIDRELRSEERRVGKECRSRWWTEQLRKKMGERE